MNKLGERIRKLREQCGLSKAELARRVGVSDVTISYWENGTIKRVGHSRLEPLAKALGCSIPHLLGNEKELTGWPGDASRLVLPLYSLTALPESIGKNATPVTHLPLGFINISLLKESDYLLTPHHSGQFDFCPQGTFILARNCHEFQKNGLYLIERDLHLSIKRLEQDFDHVLNVFGEKDSTRPEERRYRDDLIFHAFIPAFWPLNIVQ